MSRTSLRLEAIAAKQRKEHAEEKKKFEERLQKIEKRKRKEQEERNSYRPAEVIGLKKYRPETAETRHWQKFFHLPPRVVPKEILPITEEPIEVEEAEQRVAEILPEPMPEIVPEVALKMESIVSKAIVEKSPPLTENPALAKDVLALLGSLYKHCTDNAAFYTVKTIQGWIESDGSLSPVPKTEWIGRTLRKLPKLSYKSTSVGSEYKLSKIIVAKIMKSD